MEAEAQLWPQKSHGNGGVWKGWKAMSFHPFPHPLEIPAGFPHYHGYGDDQHGQKTGTARRKPAIRATLPAKGL